MPRQNQVLYEVTAELPLGRRQEYLQWLGHHVLDVLATPGFLHATWWELHAEPAAPDRSTVVSQYLVESLAALETYIQDRAPALRAEGQKRFGDTLKIHRRVLLFHSEAKRQS